MLYIFKKTSEEETKDETDPNPNANTEVCLLSIMMSFTPCTSSG